MIIYSVGKGVVKLVFLCIVGCMVNWFYLFGK